MAKKLKLSEDWPNLLSGNKVIWSSRDFDIDVNIESVELENLKCSPFRVIRDCPWRIHFSTAGTVFELAHKSMTAIENPQISGFSWRATRNHQILGCCNSAMEFQQHSRVAAWILHRFCVIFTRSRNELFSVRSLADPLKKCRPNFS